MADQDLHWRRYLSRFHSERAGVTEAVLSRTLAGDHSPYRWLARAVSADAIRVLDLASGSGAVSRELARPGRTVIGLDLSGAELDLAAVRGPGPWVRGDALRLPVADASLDAVTSSLGLVIVRPLADLLTEVARVLRPGGVLAAIAPAVRPLNPHDLLTLGRINIRLRARPQFPGPTELAGFTKTLAQVGLRRVEDNRERYSFTITAPGDAALMLSALYLPGTRQSRIEAATEYLADRLNRQGPVEVAIPMRRVVAIK